MFVSNVQNNTLRFAHLIESFMLKDFFLRIYEKRNRSFYEIADMNNSVLILCFSDIKRSFPHEALYAQNINFPARSLSHWRLLL